VGEDRPGFDEREGLMRPRDGAVRGEGSMWWLSVDDQEREQLGKEDALSRLRQGKRG
jgi:hypothetical protein